MNEEPKANPVAERQQNQMTTTTTTTIAKAPTLDTLTNSNIESLNCRTTDATNDLSENLSAMTLDPIKDHALTDTPTDSHIETNTTTIAIDKPLAGTSSSSSSDDGNNSSNSTESDRSNIVIDYKEYENELQMPDIMRLIQKDLSEPYSIYTYRYFIHKWPKFCFLAMHGDICVGAIVCKLDIHRQIFKRGYIAMLAVDQDYRKLKIGTNLVRKAIEVCA